MNPNEIKHATKIPPIAIVIGLLFVIAFELLVIASNMTVENMRQKRAANVTATSPITKVEIAKIVDRAVVPHGALGYSTGVLIETGSGLKMVPYKQGSRLSIEVDEVEYLEVMEREDGSITVAPIYTY